MKKVKRPQNNIIKNLDYVEIAFLHVYLVIHSLRLSMCVHVFLALYTVCILPFLLHNDNMLWCLFVSININILYYHQ